jgi:methionyl-tRNA formyltransferase
MRIIFMGTPDFAVPSLQALVRAGHTAALVITQPDRPQGRGRRLQPPPVKKAAQVLDLPVWQPHGLKDPEVVARLRESDPEVIVVAAYGKILPGAVLQLPPRGCINVHASLLPRYRGAAPIHWAVIDGAGETGITTMYMNEGLDTGDMILQRSIKIGSDDTVGAVHDRLAQLGADLLVETLALVERGEAPREPQEDHKSSYAPPLTRADELVNWNKPAPDIYNQIRGLNPWPGARTFWDGQVLKIWGARVSGEQAPPGSAPGLVLKVDYEKGILVAAGDATLWLTEVQLQGGRRLTAGDFLRGRSIQPGSLLG